MFSSWLEDGRPEPILLGSPPLSFLIWDTEHRASHGNEGNLNNRKTVRPFARYVVAPSAFHNEDTWDSPTA
jgi:hypothetical protein